MTSRAESNLTHIHRVTTATPEQRLIAAVLLRAVLDAGSSEKRLRTEARTWLQTSALPVVTAIAPTDSDPAVKPTSGTSGLPSSVNTGNRYRCG